MESCLKPTMPVILPMIETLRQQLETLSYGRDTDTYSKYVARLCVDELSKIAIQDMWIAASFLHPGYRSLERIQNLEERVRLREKGVRLIKKMMRKCNEENDIDQTTNFVRSDLQVEKSVVFGEHSIHAEDMMSFSVNPQVDELVLYEAEGLSESDKEDLKKPLGEIRYWVSKMSVYKTLSKVALWVLAVPVSSTPSERDFSLINRIVRPDRSRLEDDTIQSIVFFKAMLDFISRMPRSTGWWSGYE